MGAAGEDNRAKHWPFRGDRAVCDAMIPPQNFGQVACARSMMEVRRRIGRYFRADLFGDPALDMLLHLFAAGSEGRRVQVSSLAGAAKVPATTSLRYVALLEAEGLIDRYPDIHDKRIALLRLTATGRSAMERYLTEAMTLFPACP